MRKFVLILLTFGMMFYLHAGVTSFSHPPSAVYVKTLPDGAKIMWDYQLPDSVISYNDGIPRGVWAPGQNHGLGVVFDLSAFSDATLEEIDFAHYSREKVHGPYYYNIHFYDMDSATIIGRIDSLVAGDSYDTPRIELAVPLGGIKAHKTVGIFIEGLSYWESGGTVYSFPALMSDSIGLTPATSYYCFDVNDPFKEDDPNYTNIYESNLIDNRATDFIMDLWINIGGEDKKITPMAASSLKNNPSWANPTAPPEPVSFDFLNEPAPGLTRANGTIENGFAIFRGSSPDSLERLAEVGTDVREYIDSDPWVDSTYYYGVATVFEGVETERTKTVYFHPRLEAINLIRSDDNDDYIPDRIGDIVFCKGVVNTPGMDGNSKFFIQDKGAGVAFVAANLQPFASSYQVGDSVYVKGTVVQIDGMTTIEVVSEMDITPFMSGGAVDTVSTTIDAIGENLEGMLVSVANVHIVNPDAWPQSGSSSGLVQVSDGAHNISLYIDAGTDLDGWTPPADNFELVGVVEQSAPPSNLDSGYRIRPRFQSDFKTPNAIDHGSANLPAAFHLEQNYPNPFGAHAAGTSATEIKYRLPGAGKVQLTVYNTLGQQVARLVNAPQKAGNYRVIFDAKNLPSGVYFYRLKAKNFDQIRKMIYIR